MYYLYLLMDDNHKVYIGYSADLKRRLSEHTNKKVYSSKRMTEPKLFYYEAYPTEIMAKDRENKLKQYGAAWQQLKKRLGLR